MPPARWKFQPKASQDAPYGQIIHDIVEEPDAPAIVFGGVTGRVYRMDLLTGETREVLKLADNTMIYGLTLSADGSALGITSQTLPSLTQRQKRSEQRYIWEMWSYPKLREHGIT